MILIKKIQPGLWQPNEQETGAIMAVTKDRFELPDGDVLKNEIGMVVHTLEGMWKVFMQGGCESSEHESFVSMMFIEKDWLDFFYIEIKP